MWAALKKAVTGVTESLGIEIPGLPVDLGALGETAGTAVQGVTESASGAVESLTGAAVGVAGGLTGAAEGVTGGVAGAADAAAQGLPDITGAPGSIGTST